MFGYYQIKDLQSTILSTSNDFAKIAGWKSPEKAVGKTDYDMPCKASEFASEFIKMDREVMKSKIQTLTVEIQHYLQDWKIILAEKSPILNEKKQVVGLFAHGIDVSHVDSFRTYFILNKLDAKLFGKDFIQTSYSLSDHQINLLLTEKQENCLFLLIRGKTLKEIAKILGISYRTVECHVDAIKIKLNCHRKSEIIEKAIDSGFLSYIPKGLQKNGAISVL